MGSVPSTGRSLESSSRPEWVMTTSSAELAGKYGHKVALLKNGKLLEVLEAEDIGRSEFVERCHEHCPVPVRA